MLHLCALCPKKGEERCSERKGFCVLCDVSYGDICEFCATRFGMVQLTPAGRNKATFSIDENEECFWVKCILFFKVLL